MEVLQYINKLRDEFNQKKVYLSYGMSNENFLIYILNKISKMTTGFKSPKIHFKHLGTYCGDSCIDKEKGVLYLYYDLSNGGQYQYNKVIVKDFKIIKYDGDGHNQVKKIFELLDIIDVSLMDRYEKVIELNYQINDTLERDEKTKNSNDWFKIYNNKLDNNTIKKVTKLDKVHQNLLLNLSNVEIISWLNILLPIWEVERFKIIKKGFLGSESYVEGTFSNMDVPALELKEQNEIINYPDSGRGSLCSEFLVVRNFYDIEVNNGDIIKLKNIRKGSKVKEYKYLETSCEGYIAVKNIKTNEIEYLIDIHEVERAYDALFTYNRIKYRGWFNKRVDYIY